MLKEKTYSPKILHTLGRYPSIYLPSLHLRLIEFSIFAILIPLGRTSSTLLFLIFLDVFVALRSTKARLIVVDFFILEKLLRLLSTLLSFCFRLLHPLVFVTELCRVVQPYQGVSGFVIVLGEMKTNERELFSLELTFTCKRIEIINEEVFRLSLTRVIINFVFLFILCVYSSFNLNYSNSLFLLFLDFIILVVEIPEFPEQ